MMKVVITSIELKGPLKFFLLSNEARKIIKQLKGTRCLAFKKRGFWIKHYTMTLWKDENELKEFATSGAHLEAMKAGEKIAKEINTIIIDRNQLPSWQEAERLLESGTVIRY